jgi:type IV secretory pathway VirB4 component
MIAVRVPEEIRKYKEKIMFGLNARQLIVTLLALFVCVPLYYWGRNYLSDDILSWIIILIAVPLVAIGFFKFNGMPMEKFVVAFMKFELLFPLKRKYKTDNAFRDWQNEAIKEEKPKSGKERRKAAKMALQGSLERAVLIEEAEERGDNHFDAESADLITVSTGTGGGKKPNKNKKSNQEHKKKEKKKSKLQIQAEEIEEKIKNDAHYLPTKKETQIRRKWNLQLDKMRKQEVAQKKKVVSKKNTQMKKRRNAQTTIPRTTQQTIPYLADYEEGLFEVKPNKYSKVYRMQDINYRTGKEAEQVQIFCKLGEFLNYFSEEMSFSFCIDNRIVSVQEQERQIFYPMTGDSYDRHRKEYNNILRRQIMAGRNDIQVEKFVTVTIDASTPIEALLRFHKIDAEVIDNLRKIGSDAKVLSTEERLSYYHDKYRKGREGELNIDFDFIKAQGISSKDYIAPTSIEFSKKHLQIEDTYYRVMHLCNLPASLSDEFMFELCDNDFPVTTTLNIQPVAQDKGLRIVKKQLTGIEKDKIEAEKRAIKAGYSPETIQHSIKDAHAQAETLYDDMLNKNQKMFFVTITCMVQGDSLEELDENCKIMEGKARKYTSQMLPLTYQQEEGYKITLPFGYTPQDICVERTLTTESTSIFMPFSNQELFQRGGYYYGLNQISHNLVIVNRLKMKTPSGFVLGTSGSGKSFATKREILNVLLHDSETGILIIDPENEYGDFCRAFGGTVLKVSADSDVHINPMDMTEDYGLDEDDGDDTPLSVKKDKAMKKKSDYIMSIVERMISVGNSGDTTNITPVQKTIVDRCVYRCYKEFLEHDFDPAYMPTLIDLQDELDKEKDTAEGRAVAEGVEYYTRGSMDVFAHKTNIDVNNRLVVFNVRDLGDQLRQIALIIVFDFIWNRMIENKNRGVRTYCYCDEIHVMFQSYYSANFLKQLYKRGRKYGLCITGLTQNVEDLLKSEQARGMIGNSDFIMMLNQNSEDLKLLAGMLNISETQMGFVTGADAGSGLLFAEKVVVPFVDRFPSDSYLYKLMSTKFGEDMSAAEIQKQIKSIMKENTVEVPPTDKEIEEALQEVYQVAQ